MYTFYNVYAPTSPKLPQPLLIKHYNGRSGTLTINNFLGNLDEKVILRTPMRTKSNSFSEALFRTHFFVRTFSYALFRTHFSRHGQWRHLLFFFGLDTQITILGTLNENCNFFANCSLSNASIDSLGKKKCIHKLGKLFGNNS
jgi:hypothetical protein